MDKMREEFEAWAKDNRYDTERLNDCNGETCVWYASATTDIAWDVWQASRAALVVELPELAEVEVRHFTPFTGEEYHHNEDVYYEAELKIALEKAGIKYE